MQLLLSIRPLLVSPCPVSLEDAVNADAARLPRCRSINTLQLTLTPVWCVTSVHLAIPAPFVVEKPLGPFLSFSVQWASIGHFKLSGQMTDAEGERTTLAHLSCHATSTSCYVSFNRAKSIDFGLPVVLLSSPLACLAFTIPASRLTVILFGPSFRPRSRVFL